MSEISSDAIVVGGGPAGCAAAIVLARRGHRVTLLEAERGAVRKTCGEYLSSTAVRWIEHAGILPKLHEQGAIPIPEWSLSTARGEWIRRLPSPGLALSRSVLDPLLRDVCREEGVRVLEGARVQSVVHDGLQSRVHFEQDHVAGECIARVVVAAAGRAARISGLVQERPAGVRRSRYVAMKTHARPRSSAARAARVSLYALRGAYVGVVPTDAGSLNVCFLARSHAFSRGSDAAKFLEAQARAHPLWKRTWSGMDVEGARWTAVSTMDFERRAPVQAGVLHAGDAAAMVSPFWGEGMAMAFESGTMAAKHVSRILRGAAEEKAFQEYRRRWNARFSSRLIAGRILQRVFLAPRAMDAAVLIAAAFPSVLDWIVKWGEPPSAPLAPILGDYR
jgi:flavin-dependent dehydrogenase